MNDRPEDEGRAQDARDQRASAVGVEEAAEHRRRFSLIWLIPIVAVAIAGYLGYRTLSDRGPLITITFGSADGLTAGQTAVRFKAVQLGTVESVNLTDDLQHVRVRVRMNRSIENRLTDHARFWVVRPRFTPASVSGLETILSGSYIGFDPGTPGGKPQEKFNGLDDPPGVRSDVPGRTFTLYANRIGSLDRGSPVFFRDVAVGEVLSYDPPGIDGKITLHVFVRSPYDRYLHEGSRFWNASGVSISFTGGKVNFELESLRALLAGGVAFDTPHAAQDAPIAPDDAHFDLYDSVEDAAAATSRDRLTFLIYFDGSVSGLAAGAPVQMRGLRIGSVTDVNLEYDRDAHAFRVPVKIAIEPERIAYPAGRAPEQVLRLAQIMVERGLRAQLASGSLITGSKVVSLDFHDNAPPAEVRQENGEIVLPAMPGGGDIFATLSELGNKVQQIPLDQIGRNLNDTLASANRLIGGPDLRNAVSSLNGALAQVQELVRNTNRGLTPFLNRLPGIANNLDQAVNHANGALRSIQQGYGQDSDFSRQLERLMGQLTDTARSVRMLADFLDRHPESLIRGRTGQAGER